MTDYCQAQIYRSGQFTSSGCLHKAKGERDGVRLCGRHLKAERPFVKLPNGRFDWLRPPADIGSSEDS